VGSVEVALLTSDVNSDSVEVTTAPLSF